MKLLIDSATNYLFLSIINNNDIYTFHRFGKCDHSETLVDYLTKFVEDSGFNLNDCDEMIIGRGPGSYTGLRIAGTVGKTFAYLKNISFKSFSSLDLILSKYIDVDGNYIVKLPAKKGSSYVKVVKVVNSKIEVVLDECFLDDLELDKYDNFIVIEMNDDFFVDDHKVVSNLLKIELKKEDFFEYSPNYLRSVL